MQSALLLCRIFQRNTLRTVWSCRAHSLLQFQSASLCCGYNVVTIPLSVKARHCLKQ